MIVLSEFSRFPPSKIVAKTANVAGDAIGDVGEFGQT